MLVGKRRRRIDTRAGLHGWGFSEGASLSSLSIRFWIARSPRAVCAAFFMNFLRVALEGMGFTFVNKRGARRSEIMQVEVSSAAKVPAGGPQLLIRILPDNYRDAQTRNAPDPGELPHLDESAGASANRACYIEPRSGCFGLLVDRGLTRLAPHSSFSLSAGSRPALQAELGGSGFRRPAVPEASPSLKHRPQPRRTAVNG